MAPIEWTDVDPVAAPEKDSDVGGVVTH